MMTEPKKPTKGRVPLFLIQCHYKELWKEANEAIEEMIRVSEAKIADRQSRERRFLRRA
jgi:hypothetical protein